MVLGVTGGIASGKSVVADMLGDLGAVVVSADGLSREIVAPGSQVLDRLVEAFGSRILSFDGTLDRDYLGELVFSDDGARQRLNAITHPAIAELAETRLAELRRQKVPLVVYEAPLLFEAGAESRVDQVLVVIVDPDQQLERLSARDEISRTSAVERVATQWPQARKLAQADFVIDNSSTLEETRCQVESLYHYLTSAG
jgi:dephospho-CoA kinase